MQWTEFYPRLYEVFEDSRDYFVVLELVAGGELFDRIVKKSCYTEKEARFFVRIFLGKHDIVTYLSIFTLATVFI